MRLALCALCGMLAAAVVTFAFDALIPLNGLHQILLATGVSLIVGTEASHHPKLRRWAGRLRRSWRRMAVSAGERRARQGVPNASDVATRMSWLWVSYALLVVWTAVETATGSPSSVAAAPAFLASAPATAATPLGSVMAAARVAGEALLSGPGESAAVPPLNVEMSRDTSHDGSAAATYYVLREVLRDQLAQRAESPAF